MARNKAFIGVSIPPTAEVETNSTQLATKEFLANALNSINTAATPLRIKKK